MWTKYHTHMHTHPQHTHTHTLCTCTWREWLQPLALANKPKKTQRNQGVSQSPAQWLLGRLLVLPVVFAAFLLLPFAALKSRNLCYCHEELAYTTCKSWITFQRVNFHLFLFWDFNIPFQNLLIQRGNSGECSNADKYGCKTTKPMDKNHHKNQTTKKWNILFSGLSSTDLFQISPCLCEKDCAAESFYWQWVL